MALLLDAHGQVVRANRPAREFFSIDRSRLPASLVEVTLESRLFELVSNGALETEAQLVHHRRVVHARRVPALENPA